MPLAVVSIGSNMGDRLKNMSMALVKAAFFGRLKALSDIYETPPVGYASQGDFLNGAMAMETDTPPLELMAGLLEIEAGLGRVRGFKNGPRTVDLDIIFYGGVSMEVPELVLPHPRWTERDFVITPLLDLLEKGVLDSEEFSGARAFLKGKKRAFKPFLKV